MELVIAVVVAALPAAWAAWSGRRILVGEEETVPERLVRHRARTLLVTWLAIVAVAILAGVHAWWLGPLAALGALAGGFPVRRELLEERWDLGSYLVFTLRIFLALGGFWILLAQVPFLVSLASPGLARIAVASALGLVLLAVIQAFPGLFARILPTGPWKAEQLVSFGEGPDLIDERATVDPPRRYRVLTGGGCWPNALAVPGDSGAVFVGDTLFEILGPDEVAAIYAHEVAHLEDFAERSLGLRLSQRGLVVLACVLPFALPSGLAGHLGWSWPLVLVLGILSWLSRSREREHRSDLRALDLGADPEALIRGLTALHVAARLPRRLAGDVEAGATHPSLARRIRAIREAAESEPPADVEEAILGTEDEGTWIVLDRERLTRFRGVEDLPGDAAGGAREIEESAPSPDATPRPSPDALRFAARRATSIHLSELSELRLEPGRRGRTLLVVGEPGRRRPWRIALTPDSVADAQRILDEIDIRVGASDSVPGRPVLVDRAVAALGAVVALVPPGLPSAAVLAVLAAVRPRGITVTAFGAGGVLGAALGAAGWGFDFSTVDDGKLLSTIGLGVIGLAAVVLGVGRARSGDVRWGKSGVVILGVGTLVVAVGLSVVALGRLVAGDPWGAHRVARGFPGGPVLLVGTAAALAVGPGRWRRVAAVPVVSIALVLVALGTRTFADRAVDDPLFPPAGLTGIEEPADSETVILSLEEGATAVRLSPGGKRVALRFDDEDWTASPRWRVLALPEGDELDAFRAADVGWSGEDLLVAVAPRAEHERARVIADWSVVERKGGEVRWSVDLPPLVDPALTVAGEGWRIEGRSFAVGEEDPVFVTGPYGGEAVAWRPSLPNRDPSGWAIWTFLGPGAFAFESTIPDLDDPLATFFSFTETRLWWHERGGDPEERLVTRASTTCVASVEGDSVLCSSSPASGRIGVWRIPVDGGPVHLGTVSSSYPVLRGVPGGGVVVSDWSERAFVVGPEPGRVRSYRAEEGDVIDGVDGGRGGVFGMTVDHVDRGPRLFVFRPADAGDREDPPGRDRS